MSFNGQSAQDLFVLFCTGYKQGGFFLEIGSNDPVKINNTYPLEKDYSWKGIMVEYDPTYLPSYKQIRPHSTHIIQDATTIQFDTLFASNNVPQVLDYVQIDLEVENKSTLQTLENLESQVMNSYTFRVITFEHDIYRGDYFETRAKSRAIFEKHGYIRIFSDVKNNGCPYEDWYVHSSYMNDTIQKLITDSSLEYTDIVTKLLEAHE